MSTLNISLDTPLILQTRWPTVSRGGGILWRPHSRTACFFLLCSDRFLYGEQSFVCVYTGLIGDNLHVA